MDQTHIADQLALLTSGWKTTANQKPETLVAARTALAGTIAMGKKAVDLHAAAAKFTAKPVDPSFKEEIRNVVQGAPALGAAGHLAYVRSAVSIDAKNPTGVPAWARGAKVQQSYGPFLDGNGLPVWVDLFPITISAKFAFGTAANVFAVFPVQLFIVEPAGQLKLGEGSVWFSAKLMAAGVPDAHFAGFRIKSGNLKASAPFTLQGGVYVLPANAKVTLTATLEPPVAPAPAGRVGADASSDQVQLPTTVTISFTQNAATVDALDPLAVTVYGSTVNLTWAAKPPVAIDQNAVLVIPCNASTATFDFANVQSDMFTPAGVAAILSAGWALPIAATAATGLGEASGAGSVFLELGVGASAQWQVHKAAADVTTWQMLVDPVTLVVVIVGAGDASSTTFDLWPEREPSKRDSSIVFQTVKEFLVFFTATAGSENLLAFGQVTAHLDRPLSADGSRFAFKAGGVVDFTRTSAGTQAILLAVDSDVSGNVVSIALKNALIGVKAPAILFALGPIEDGSFLRCDVVWFLDARWLLPTLPDPYAANFGLEFIHAEGDTGIGTLGVSMAWDGQKDVVLAIDLNQFGAKQAGANQGSLAAPPQGHLDLAFLKHSGADAQALQASAATGDLRSASFVRQQDPRRFGFLALLDLSTHVDQFGVAAIPNSYGTRRQDLAVNNNAASNLAAAPAVGFSGMSLALNAAYATTFALPQVSWEPMETTSDPPGPIFRNPASDGVPLLLLVPDQQTLVPFSPKPVLKKNLDGVAAGIPFFAEFSLPFGLNAFISQPNAPPNPESPKATFLNAGGEMRFNRPLFDPKLRGAVQVTMKPPNPEDTRAQFSGVTLVDAPYGRAVLSDDVATIFENEFGPGPQATNAGVPLRRIDLAGYGASIFSEWSDEISQPPDITKVQFETIVGRTGYEVVKAVTILYPYGVRLVRTVTIQRQKAGWIQRSDSGWQPASQGLFVFPNAASYVGRIHRGAVAGVFNVRNIRESENYVYVPKVAPPLPQPQFEFRQVIFDADVGIDARVDVLSGGHDTNLVDANNKPVTLVAARDLVGYVQLGPDKKSPEPDTLAGLFEQTGPLSTHISCVAGVGGLGAAAGPELRCSAIEVDIIRSSNAGKPTPALGAALRAAPKLPGDGAWGFGQRKKTDPSPSALTNDFPLPMVQPSDDLKTWYFANIHDVLQIANPDNFYGLLQNTGTQKLLFDQPRVPILDALSPPGSTPGFHLPNPPNFADVASLLNATGLFPDISNTISLLVAGATEQLQTQKDGLKYSKTYNFDPNHPLLPLLDLGVIKVSLSYADESAGRTGGAAKKPTVLTYTLDPTAAKRWSFSIQPLSFLVTVPVFGTDPLLMVVGGFVADDQTKPTLTGLNIVYGGALDSLKSVFSRLQTLAQFLPGGKGAELNVALSDGKLTVTDTFAIPTLPLGLGELSDISLDVGLTLQLSPLSADFSVGIGNPGNPFNWIVSPLAGNGLIDVGMKGGKPELTVQGGIGLGLAIDLGIASGSASITIGVLLDVTGSKITFMAILNGQASVDVLDGLASASVTLTAALGVSVDPFPVPVPTLAPPGFHFPSEEIGLLASVSVGIHLTVCWVASVDWDGSWQFSQTVHTPAIDVSL